MQSETIPSVDNVSTVRLVTTPADENKAKEPSIEHEDRLHFGEDFLKVNKHFVSKNTVRTFASNFSGEFGIVSSNGNSR